MGATPRLTRLELEVMDLFWDQGPATVRQVLELLPPRRRPAYTTVLTVVSRLEEKGALERSGKVSNAVVYRPRIARRAIHRRLVRELLDHVGAQRLVAHLVEEGHLSLAELRELEAALERRTSDGERKA
jgi:BlaI family transcriptional regulator, penicillinase repressor